jgi:hypothetical protein
VNPKICDDSCPNPKQRQHEAFDNANKYAADYILQGENQAVIGRNLDDTPFVEARIDGVATAVADFDPIRVLRNVRKVLEETEDLDKQDLAAALGKTLITWSEKWSMPKPTVQLNERQAKLTLEIS